MSKRLKRRRGGQPGNQNARKHGLYSNRLTPAEIQALGQEPILDPDDIGAVILRNKTLSALDSHPADPRVVREGLHRMYNYLFSRFPVSPAEKKYIKRYIRQMLKTTINYSTQLSARSAGTIQPQIVPDIFNAFFRNQSSLNPEIRLKPAGTVEAADI
jgi:hypothetical protein